MANLAGSTFAEADSAILSGAGLATSAVLNGETFVYVPSEVFASVTIYAVGNDGTMTQVGNVNDSTATSLGGAISAKAFEVAGNSFLAVAGYLDDAVNIFALSDTAPYLTLVDRAIDTDNPGYELDGASHLATYEGPSGTFLYVGSPLDQGFSVFEVFSDGSLISVQNVADSSFLEVRGGIVTQPFSHAGSIYLPVGGGSENGFSLFLIDPASGLASLHLNVETDAGFFARSDPCN